MDRSTRSSPVCTFCLSSFSACTRRASHPRSGILRLSDCTCCVVLLVLVRFHRLPGMIEIGSESLSLRYCTANTHQKSSPLLLGWLTVIRNISPVVASPQVNRCSPVVFTSYFGRGVSAPFLVGIPLPTSTSYASAILSTSTPISILSCRTLQ